LKTIISRIKLWTKDEFRGNYISGRKGLDEGWYSKKIDAGHEGLKLVIKTWVAIPLANSYKVNIPN